MINDVMFVEINAELKITKFTIRTKGSHGPYFLDADFSGEKLQEVQSTVHNLMIYTMHYCSIDGKTVMLRKSRRSR